MNLVTYFDEHFASFLPSGHWKSTTFKGGFRSERNKANGRKGGMRMVELVVLIVGYEEVLLGFMMLAAFTLFSSLTFTPLQTARIVSLERYPSRHFSRTG